MRDMDAAGETRRGGKRLRDEQGAEKKPKTCEHRCRDDQCREATSSPRTPLFDAPHQIIWQAQEKAGEHLGRQQSAARVFTAGVGEVGLNLSAPPIANRGRHPGRIEERPQTNHGDHHAEEAPGHARAGLRRPPRALRGFGT